MALGTVTSVKQPAVPGNERISVVEVGFSSSYTNEGETLSAEALGLKSVTFAIATVVNGSENEAEFPVDSAYYTTSNSKIHLLNSKTSKEVASTKNVEKVKVLVVAFGS
jgi:hypothetical protein